MTQYISDEGSVDKAPPPGVRGGHEELERVVRPGGLQGCHSLIKNVQLHQILQIFKSY